MTHTAIPLAIVLLVQIGERLRACIAENDVAARLGGDGFAILLTSLKTRRAP